jgi:hypothetical protein
MKTQSRLLQMLADQAAIAIRVHHLRQAKQEQMQPGTVKATAPALQMKANTVGQPSGIFKRFLKMPWSSQEKMKAVP